MQVNDLTMHYNNHTTSSAETANGTKGIERLVSAVREMTAGNIFEGTVNSLKNGQVVLGLSNGSELLAKLDANVPLAVGQSMFFQVKSNDGNTIAIRPYTVDGAGANLTLMNALKAANLPITDKFLTMANSMMEEQLPIDKNSLSQMARILMANPDMSVNTLVQMKKTDLPLTQEMIAQFENYVDDKNAVHSAIDRFIEQLPQALTNETLSAEQLKAFDAQFLAVLAEGMEESALRTENSIAQQEGVLSQKNPTQQTAMPQQEGTVSQTVMTQQEGTVSQTVMPQQEGIAQQVLESQSMVTGEEKSLEQNPNRNEKELSLEKVTDAKKEQLLTAINKHLGNIEVTKEDNAYTILTKLSEKLLSDKQITKTNVQEFFADKQVKNFLKDVLEQQLLLSPKEVVQKEKVEDFYKKLESKMGRLETLMQNAGIKDTPISQTLSDIRANVEFMNQLNQAYTYVQIPLKMTNQNASAQLYVYTNKRDLQDPERELTAFLHLDLEHLGATDISVRMHKKQVSTKFYMDNDAAYDLIEAHMSVLEERLRQKGYSCTIEVLNEGKKVNFVEDFLKKDAPVAGQLHRYSFDVRA